MPLRRDSAMNSLFFKIFVKMCVPRGWCHMPFGTLLMWMRNQKNEIT